MLPSLLNQHLKETWLPRHISLGHKVTPEPWNYFINIGRNIQHNAEKFAENATIINKLIKDEIRLFSVNLGHPDVGM